MELQITNSLKTLLTFLLVFCLYVNANAQRYKSKTSEISFFSEAPLEDIKAINTDGTSIIDFETNKFAFSIPIQSFEFKKSLMQQHFNEKYMESEEFPKSTFTGALEDYSYGANDSTVVAVGSLTIHGVTKQVKIPGVILNNENKITVRSKFMVLLEDYDIKIPTLMWNKIAEEIEVTITFNYEPYE